VNNAASARSADDRSMGLVSGPDLPVGLERRRPVAARPRGVVEDAREGRARTGAIAWNDRARRGRSAERRARSSRGVVIRQTSATVGRRGTGGEVRGGSGRRARQGRRWWRDRTDEARQGRRADRGSSARTSSETTLSREGTWAGAPRGETPASLRGRGDRWTLAGGGPGGKGYRRLRSLPEDHHPHGVRPPRSVQAQVVDPRRRGEAPPRPPAPPGLVLPRRQDPSTSSATRRPAHVVDPSRTRTSRRACPLRRHQELTTVVSPSPGSKGLGFERTSRGRAAPPARRPGAGRRSGRSSPSRRRSSTR
jgi:hypothetical protein